VKKYLDANIVTCPSAVHDSITSGDVAGFQRQFTAFLQEYLELYCTPHHKEQVYQGMCYMLIFTLFGKEYDVRMEQDAGHGRSDITAHPFSPQRLLALIFEIKSVARYVKRNGKQSFKTCEHMEKDLEREKIAGLAQLEERRYRERVPLHATKVHEYVFAFCGMFCVAAVRTLERNATGGWQQVAADSTVVSGCMVDANMGEDDVEDEDEEA
jgi:PD-(D/E)XK nuclease superfamily